MGSIKGIQRGKYRSRGPSGNVVCSRCSKAFKRRQSLLQHIRSVHLKIQITCTICRKNYTSKSVYNRHLKNVHGIINKLSHDSNLVKAHGIEPSNLINLSFEVHSVFPSMAKFLALKQNKKFGVHVITKEDISVDKVVIAASAFASIEYLFCTSSGCFTCGKITEAKIRCLNCIDVSFCSNKCKTNRTHRTKCDTYFNSSDCHIVRLTTQIISVAINEINDINTMIEFVQGLLFKKKNSAKCQPPFSQYGEILRLKESPVFANASKARRAVHYVMQLPQIQSQTTDTEQLKRILFNLAYRHANIIELNAFSEKTNCTKGGAIIRLSIYDVLSRLNHSCDPNVTHHIDDDDYTYCVVSRPIQTGEQLFINYLSQMEFQSNQERKRYIKETWNFDCKCNKCC